MKKITKLNAIDLSRISAIYTKANIINASARWQPTSVNRGEAQGFSGVCINLTTKRGCLVKVGISRSAQEGFHDIWFMYKSPGSILQAPTVHILEDQAVHMELDIDAKMSRATYWVNDHGFDMGHLPGFEGGADSVEWHVAADSDGHMLNGNLVDCAMATAKGWMNAGFQEAHFMSDKLHANHSVQVLSPNRLSLSDKRILI